MSAPNSLELAKGVNFLQSLINQGESHLVDIPAHGKAWASVLETGQGKLFLGWCRHRDEEGSLVWGDPVEVKKGEYNVLFYNPYENPPDIKFVRFIDNGEKRIAIPWTAIHGLLALMSS